MMNERLSDGRSTWIRRSQQVPWIAWLDRSALSPDEVVEGTSFRILRPEEFQLLVLLRIARAIGSGEPVDYGHFSDDELQAIVRRSVLFGGIHHAGCRLGLAHTLP